MGGEEAKTNENVFLSLKKFPTTQGFFVAFELNHSAPLI
jgi:hypothetical protein